MNQIVASNYGECPCCHDTGWEVYKATVFEYGEPEELEFAKSCQRCSGKRRANDLTGIPEKYHDADLHKFDFDVYSCQMGKIKQICENFVKNFQGWEKYGKGLYFWSKTPGSGKTFLSSCLANAIMIRQNVQMRFITAPDYIGVVGDSYKRTQGMEDASAVYRECKLLVLDDIGAQKTGDWQNQELFRLVNHRLENSGITIFTSNVPPEQLTISDRTIDRIIKSSVVLQMPEERIRRKLALREQNDFLERIDNE